MADVLVVGGNGFIGSYVVDALVARGHRVAAFDRFGNSPARYVAEGVEQISGDFMNVADVRAAVSGRDVVLHFLSTTDPASAENDPTLDVRTNITSSIEMFQLCAESGVEKVFFASTGGAIYGDQDQQTFRETDPTYPVSPYAIGKLAIENYLRYFNRKHDLGYTVFRISNPYGPRQNPAKRQGVIPIFLRQIARDEPLTIFGDGSMVRDYVYVEDLAAMVATAVTEGTRRELYNLGSGVGHSVTEIVRGIEVATGRRATLSYREKPATFVDHVTLDTTRFCEDFGAPHLTELTQGITRTWTDMLGNPS